MLCSWCCFLLVASKTIFAVASVHIWVSDVGGADGEGDKGSARVSGAEQEDVPARALVAGLHGQGTGIFPPVARFRTNRVFGETVKTHFSGCLYYGMMYIPIFDEEFSKITGKFQALGGVPRLRRAERLRDKRLKQW